jgi:hypothetical protein
MRSAVQLEDDSVLFAKYHSGDEVKKTEMGRTCGTYGGDQRCIQGFSGERRPLGRPRRRWKDNIKMDIREVGWRHGLYRSGSGQEQVGALVNAVMNLRIA